MVTPELWAGTPPAREPERWVVLAVSSDRQAIVVGNAYGNSLDREDQADRLRDRLRKEHPSWNFLTLPITSRKEWGQ